MTASIPIRIDTRSVTPIYEQVMRQVRHAIAVGAAAPGAALPSVRALAVRLRVNPNTVARAYRELEAEGVVETRRGQGTFVSAQPQAVSASKREEALAPLLDQAVLEARALGFEREEVHVLIDATWDRLGPNPRETER